MSRPYRNVLTRYKRFRRPFARVFGYTLTESLVGQLRVASGDGFIYTSTGEPLYPNTP